MQSANLSGPFRGCLYYALLGLPQATGLAGGYDLLQPHRTEVRLTGKYRYLTFEDRKKIEAWHLLGDRPVDIAARLSVHHTTIYKELQRGATGLVDSAAQLRSIWQAPVSAT